MSSFARTKRTNRQIDYWPGFVDALSTLLLSIMFLLSVFVIAQFFLSQEISGKDKILDRLTNKINELTEILALERSNTQGQIAHLRASLSVAEKEKKLYISESKDKVNSLTEKLENEKKLSQGALTQIERLNEHIAALLNQISALENTLETSEQKEKESKSQISDLGKRLNVALAERVQELSQYRSEFFGKLRDILSHHKNIRIVGDRFVFQSEVLFQTGSSKIDESGKIEIKKLAQALIKLEKEIPPTIHWILRVDGHTDDRKVSGSSRYASNWELSSARAISVVKYLIENGVSSHRLAAAGFGEFQPIDPTKTEQARSKNRRIELKLTEK